MEFRKKLLLYMFLTASVGERRKQSHCLTVYFANRLKHGAAGSPARWKQHVKQTTLRNRGNMIFQHLKTIFFTSIISTACVVGFLFKFFFFFFLLVFNDCWGGQLYG